MYNTYPLTWSQIEQLSDRSCFLCSGREDAVCSHGHAFQQAFTGPMLYPLKAHKKYPCDNDHSPIVQRILTKKHWHVLPTSPKATSAPLSRTKHHTTLPPTPPTHAPRPPPHASKHNPTPSLSASPPQHHAPHTSALTKANHQPDRHPLKHVLRHPPSLPHAFRFNTFVSNLPTCLPAATACQGSYDDRWRCAMADRDAGSDE